MINNINENNYVIVIWYIVNVLLFLQTSLMDILIGKDWNKLTIQLLKSKLIPLSHNSSIKQRARQFILQWIDFIDAEHSQVSIADANTISVNHTSLKFMNKVFFIHC